MSDNLDENKSLFLEPEIIKILDDPKIAGEITDKSHPLVKYVSDKGNKLKKSKIEFSYTNAQIKWREIKKDEDSVYLFRISNKIDDKVKKLIINEFQMHKNCEELNNISPRFLCYYFSNYLNFSIFCVKNFYTLEEILEQQKKNEKLISLNNEDSYVEFSQEDLLSACIETIKNLIMDGKYYICPYLTPSNLLFTDSKEYFFLSEIFLVANSPEEDIEFELNNKKVQEWLVPEFVKNKAILSFQSNIFCLGNLFYKIVFDVNPKNQIKIDDNSIYKDLIYNCIKKDKKERWAIEEIEKYINENNFEDSQDKDINNDEVDKEKNDINSNININNNIKNEKEKHSEIQVKNINFENNEGNNLLFNKKDNIQNDIKDNINPLIINKNIDNNIKYEENNKNMKEFNNEIKIENNEKNGEINKNIETKENKIELLSDKNKEKENTDTDKDKNILKEEIFMINDMNIEKTNIINNAESMESTQKDSEKIEKEKLNSLSENEFNYEGDEDFKKLKLELEKSNKEKEIQKKENEEIKEKERLENERKINEEKKLEEEKKLMEKIKQEKMAKMLEELELNKRMIKEYEEENKKIAENKKKKEEEEMKKRKEEEINKKKNKEEEEKKEREKIEEENLRVNELQNQIKILQEKVEKNNIEKQKRLEIEQKEKLKEEEERIKKKKEEEEEAKKRNEEEEKIKKEKEKQEQERKLFIEQKNQEIIKLQEQLEKQREEEEQAKKRKDEEEKRKKEEENRIKDEFMHTINYPDGISSKKENTENKKIEYIHLEIKFIKEPKELEIYDIHGPSKSGYKFYNYENNKYYVVFPFYKFNKNSIIFGVRDTKEKSIISDNDIYGEHLTFNKNKKYWELTILKKENYEMIFNIYNVPKEINKINYLKFLNQLNLKNYIFTLDCIREITFDLKFNEILDLIMEIGINKLSEILMKIIIDRKIDIYPICQHLENIIKNKNNIKFQDKFYEIAPNIIYLYRSINTENVEKEENNEKNENDYGERKCLLCLDNNIPTNLYPDNFKKDLIEKTIENLGISPLEKRKTLLEKKEKINTKLIEYNKVRKMKGLKEITCILTDTTVKKLSQLEYGIKANIPMIIQGFTSAGKSFLSTVASKINERDCLTTALSEHTTIEDLLGRDVIKADSSVKFIPGILLLAYKEGKTLILDECDLAKPEILSCILGSMTKSELIICNQTFRKMEGYNVILTMNGEVKGFTEKQRNILTTNILSKFNLIQFDEMEKEECKEIFKSLLNQNDNSSEYIKKIEIFIEIHQKMIDYMKKKEEKEKNIDAIDPIVTLRNLKYCCYLSRNKIHPRIAAEISYTARFPENERKDFEPILNKFGKIEDSPSLKNIIEKYIKENFLYYNDTYKNVVYLALTALNEGLHPLLIGEKGCGLTTLAKLIASISNKDYEFLLCSSETSVEDLIGCYQPKIKLQNKNQDLSAYIKWCDGPVPRAGQKGVPLILDNINFSKPQVIECLNPLLEDNTKYNNVEYNILEKENSGSIKMKKGFSIIGTMSLNKDNKNSISKALMNRFVAIYVDNDLKITKENINIIIGNTCKKLDKQIKELNSNINNNLIYQEEIKDEPDYDDDIIDEEDEIEEDENNLVEKEEKNEIPEWYKIIRISNETVDKIKEFLVNEYNEAKNLKSLIKRITKLALVYERINKFGFTMKDCNDLISLKFEINDENKEIYDNLQKNILFSSEENKNKLLNSGENKNILLNSEENKNRFFFDDINSDSWKMIMSLISGDISNTSIFLQGTPGSGKSCAARHFGSYRIFQSRNPILSVNCNKDLKFDYLVGNYNFKDSKFNFVDGPLVTAMKKGECILLDEFNLCPENILINLLPIFKANIGDKIYLKGVPEPIYITPGFLLIATGNSSKEKGRNVISSIILDEILTLEIKTINLMTNTNLIKNILEKGYKEIYQDDNSFEKDKISVKQIIELDKYLNEDLQFKLSLRQIKCLLERIIRFCVEENYMFGGFIKIPVIYVIISYIIPQLKIWENSKELIEKLDKIMKYENLSELMEFIGSKVEFESTKLKIRDKLEEKRFVKKGKICLVTNMSEDIENTFPQVALQTFFWIRMSCFLKSETPGPENLLLIGATSYKEYLLNEWLSLKVQKDKIDSYYLTKNTETENLIGSSSLDDEKKLDVKIENLTDNAIIYFHLDSSNFGEENNLSKFKLIKKHKDENPCLNYIYETLKKLKKLKRSFRKKNQIGLKTVTSFNLGIVPKAFMFGKKLILKGIENPETSIIERLNPILENPRNLIITEDNQEIYNDEKIYRKIYKKNIKSVPENEFFRIFFTSNEFYQVKLSNALKSRLTIINCPDYDSKKYLTMELKHEQNYETICKSIVGEKGLVDEIINFNKILLETENIDIEFLRFIRWCKSTKKIFDKIKKIKYKTLLHKDDNLYYKYIVGISTLRSIIDRFESKIREEIIKNYFEDYLPDKLFKLLTSEYNNNLESFPLELIEYEGKKYICSIYSGIIFEFPDNENPNNEALKGILWTKSSVDIADAIIVSLISNTVLILDGPPGRGKTAISKAIYNYLNIDGENLKRINFSPSTLIEDVFARTIPKIDAEKVSTERKVQGLLSIIERCQNSEYYYKHGLILDEINLASDMLLEYLYSYLDSILTQGSYISPDGVKYKNIGNIGIIATMNDAKLSNSRTSLSNSFINRCHLFKLSDYSSNEKVLLAEQILTNINKDTLIKIMKCFNISEEISSKYSDIGGNNFRDILKLKQFIDKCEEIPIDYLLDLILSRYIPASEMENFLEKTGLNMISNSLNDLKLKIVNNYLCFDKFVKYKLINPKKYGIKEQFTISQKEALMKMMIGLLAERPILLSGDIGTGKTFIVEQLADLIGANLKVIQFNSDTTNLDIIGRLELTIDKNKINTLKNSIYNFIEHLIEIRYKKITEIIVETELLDIAKLKKFFEVIKKDFYLCPNDIQEEYKMIYEQLKNLTGIKKTNFNFKLSALVRAMKEGDWILLDDINFAPQEIEGLMSLLEEDPTLKIYENDPVLFFTKDKKKIINKDSDFEIHPNFRLIMTTSKDTNISQAIKSRCLCLQIKPFKKPKDYADLIANNLKYSDIAENNIIDISKKIGHAFYKLKEDEDQSNYILKNYILSSVNLVNFSKMLIFWQPIDENILAQTIDFCFFAPFKKSEKKKEIIESFKKNILLDIDMEIIPIRNIKRSHEYLLKKLEIDIFSYYFKSNIECKDILKKMNEKNEKTFIHKNAELKESLINKNITIEKIKEDISRKELLVNLDSFTLLEIKEYISDIDEVIIIIKLFLEENDKLYQYLYFLNYLKKILVDLSSIDEDQKILYGLKINKMECNKNFFMQYNIKEDLAIKYTKILIKFKNMIYYFEKIIPEKIFVLELEKSIFAIYYKFYQGQYKDIFENNMDYRSIFPFILLSNQNFRGKLKKLEFCDIKGDLIDLFNLLKFYDGEINIDLYKKEIYIIKYDLKIPFNNDINFEEIRKNLDIKKSEINTKICFNNKIIDYYYPNQFYREENKGGNILQLFFFFEFFIKEYMNDNEIKKIFPEELYDFNHEINLFLSENKNYTDGGEKLIYDSKYNFIDIIKMGYKLLEVLMEVKKDNIRFNKGINFFKVNNNNYLDINEENIDIVLEKIDVIKKYFNKEQFWDIVNDKYHILEEKKKELIFRNKKSEFEKKLVDLQIQFRAILNDNNYEFLKNLIEQIENGIKDNNNKNDIEQSIINLEKKLIEIKKSEEHKEIEDIQKDSPKNIDLCPKLLYDYSKLSSVIEQYKNINMKHEFIGGVSKFQKIMKKYQSNIDIFGAYQERIFSECENDSPVTKDIIDIFNHMANSFLINEVINNNIEKTFVEYLNKIIKVDRKNIKDISNLFYNDEEFIYFPKLNNQDIIYCFRYGEDNFKSGGLNPTKKIILLYDENESFSRKEIILNIKDNFQKLKIKEENLNKIDNILSKILEFYDKMENLEYNIDVNWLITPLNDLKSEAIKYPNRIITKNKYGYLDDFDYKIFNGKKISIKALLALAEGNKNIETIYGGKSILNEIIMNFHKLNKNFKYGYRIMIFYDFHLFEDHQSKTMKLIIETIYNILKTDFKDHVNVNIDNPISKEIKQILKKIYTNFIDLVLSSEFPQFENNDAVHFFDILYFSILDIFKNEYEKLQKIFQDNKQKIINLFKTIESEITKAINLKIYEYNKKNEIYLRNQNNFEKEVEEKAQKYYEEIYLIQKGYYHIKYKLKGNKLDKLDIYKNTYEYKRLKENNHNEKPIYEKIWNNYKNIIKKIKNHLNEINIMKDLYGIINDIKKLKAYIETNTLQKYNDLENTINLNIDNLRKIKSYLDNFPKKCKPLYFPIYKIQGVNLDLLCKIISCFNNNSYYDSLFKIEKIFIRKGYNENLNVKKIYIKQDSNFIFEKGNNKPAFLKKCMKINLGLYILGCELKNIGLVTIPNNYKYKLKFSIEQDKTNEIIIKNNARELNPYQDLQIGFNLNIPEKSPGFYSSKFELILINENKDTDKCEVFAFINIIPLILKFSIPGMKYNIENGSICISHHLEKLIIFHSFPGNYFSESLKYELKKANIDLNYDDKENKQNNGKLILTPKLIKYNENVNYEFSLSLLSSILLKFKAEYRNPNLTGIRIFNKEYNNLKSIKIIKTMGKSIFLFNMWDETIKLKIKNNKDDIELTVPKQELAPKEILKIEIKNINIKHKSEIKINDKSLIVENVEIPSIQLDGSMFQLNWNYNDKKETTDIQNFKLILIDKNFYKKERKISPSTNYMSETNIFSAYLIYNNNIIKELTGKYNNNYSGKNQQKYRKIIYGFSDKEFDLFKLSDPNLQIALSYKVDYNSNYMSIFNDEIKYNIKNKYNSNKEKIISNDINKINSAISDIINFKIDISKKNPMEKLIITDDKTSIENIIKYLLKFSVKYKKSDDLRDYLQNIYNKIIKASNRKVSKLFISTVQDEKIKLILDKLSYILSFLFLIIIPGDILEYEYKYEENFEKEDEFKEIENNYKYLLKEYDSYFIKKQKKDYVLNKDIIYYNNSIKIHKENDEFSKYEKQILDNDIKLDEKIVEESKEFINSCFNDIIKLTDDIKENKITISNLVLFLENSKKILAKIPFILSEKDNEEKIKTCINGIYMIHDYLNELIKTSINNSEFKKLIEEHLEEFKQFISKFENYNKEGENFGKLISFECVTKCELPSDNKKANSTRKGQMRNIKRYKLDIENKFLMDNIEMEKFDSQFLENEKYENKKDYKFKKKEDKKNIKYQIKLSENERKSITMEGTLKDYLIPKVKIFKERNILKNKLTDFHEEIFQIEDISKLFENIKNITATKFLRDIMKIISNKNQKYSIIRDINQIQDLIKGFDNTIEQYNSEFYKCYSNNSSKLQNIISNLIRQKILNYDENEILPYTLQNSYLDILIDISATMSEDQRIASLLLCTGLSLSLSTYGIKIRISVFSERNNVWVLTNEFSSENLKHQLSRLRDALSFRKRLLSFPADALKKLKNSFYEKYEHKYCQILISNCISSQIVDKKLNWNELGQRIIVFGLKSIFEKNFQDNNPNIYEKILKIPTKEEAQIIQEFFEPSEIIFQLDKLNKPYSKLINAILETLLEKNEKIEGYNIKDIIINDDNYQKNQNNYNNIEILKTLIDHNLKEKKYFTQNISFSKLTLSKFRLEKIPKKSNIPSLSELEKLSSKNNYNKNYSLEEFVPFFVSLLTPLFRQILPSNIASGKLPCSSGGSLSIQGIKKWICSGFTYTYIFEKRGSKNKKKYNLSYIIDLSKSVLLLCNYSHCIATIILLLIAPSTVEDNEDIYIDVIINTINGIKIVDFNSKCTIFQNINKINEIINIINEEINNSCCPGSCLYTAYHLLLERREDKKIFLITDGYVSDQNEIELVLHFIENCENEGIELVTIGVGTFPKGIKEVYPNCCYAPSIRSLQDSLFSCFFYSKETFSNSFEPNLVLVNIDEFVQNRLEMILKENPKDKILENSIMKQPLTSVFDMIENENSRVIEGCKKLLINPEEEPYYDLFDDFKILIVILYLGNDEHDKNITTEIFEKNAGKSLKKKGFKYDIVYSYGEAIKKLSTIENNNCPYSELWLFCSKGDGSLPEKAEDKDSNKITIFLEMVTDFNKKGGALFLFCDNYPFVLEANLLLKEYIKFDEGKINFEMTGSYNNENPKGRFIFEKGRNFRKNGYFEPDIYLKCLPGKAKKRFSLRLGLNTFSEGITLSYAQTFDNSENYRPFTPFAYLSDPFHKRPFILYYDPKIETGMGPIVVHGGFTSAFYDFEQTGTGRLVISIACWLIRKEEILFNDVAGVPKLIPGIKIPIIKYKKFDKWIKPSIAMFSILILDVSGSMTDYYESLFGMANKILRKQMENKDNEGVIIIFSIKAKTIVDGKLNLLNLSETKNENKEIFGSKTNFYNAFKEAEKYIFNKNKFMKKRILFLTDGKSETTNLKPICNKMINEGFQINIVGFDNPKESNEKKSDNKSNVSSFEHLRKFASPNCFYTSQNFEEIEIICQNIFAAE